MIYLIISSPDKKLFEGNAKSISVRGSEGDLAILQDHIPFLTTTKQGKAKVVDENGKEIVFNVSAGILTVEKERTILLCSQVEKE